MLCNKPLLCTLLASTALLSVSQAMASPALPTHGTVVSGQAAISTRSSGVLTVSQSSQSAIINWNSFSIGQGGTVQINNGSGATLNRVTGGSISSIDGLLSATGSVYLINPNGVIISKTGVVNTGGSFVASTLDISNNAFLGSGALAFSGSSTTSVVNLGRVGSLGGNVALIASTVENDGTLTAPNGTVGLVAGQQVTLKDADNDGNGLFSVQVGGSGTTVANTGLIVAADAELRAEQGNVYALAGNTAGMIRATGVNRSDGKIWLVADGGATTVAGTLDAQGAKGAAGQIETSGQTVKVDAATIDAHGGQWLLDPQDIEITPAAATTISTALATSDVTEQTTATGASEGGTSSGATVSSGPGDITLDSGATISWSSSHALTLNAYNNLTLTGAISLSGSGSLNLSAGQALAINAPITVSGAGAVNLAYNAAAAANFTFNDGANVVFSSPTQSGALSINGQTYTLIYTSTALQNMTPGGDYALAASIDLTGSTWTPIGATAGGAIVGDGFTGVFDGLGNTISNLTLTSTKSNVGLFGDVGASGAVTNVTLANANVTGGTDTGALAGESSGILSGDAVSSGMVAGANDVGGLVGYNTGTIDDITLRGSVQGANYVGALTGYNTGSISLVQGYDTSIHGTNDVGGLIGYSSGGDLITDTTYAEAVSGASYVGGVVGYLNSGTLSGAQSVSNIQASGTYVGGLAGYNAGAVYGGAAYEGAIGPTLFGTINGASDVGGAVGYNTSTGTLNYTKAYGDVTGTGANTGGLVGYNAGGITNAIAQGTVSGQNFTGGLTGYNSGTINSISADTTNQVVGGAIWVGGLTGYSSGTIGATDGAVASNATVTATGNASGGLVGQNVGTITNAATSGSVSGLNQVGGLIGLNSGGVTNASASASVSATGYVGGLIGYNSGSISGSSATGQVSGQTLVGGLVGYNTAAGVITNIAADSTAQVVGGVEFVGGLVGYNLGSVGSAGSTVAANATVTDTGGKAGGLIGYNTGTVTNATSAGSVSGVDDDGGLVGQVDGGSVTGSSSSSTVNGATYVGGLIGSAAAGSTVSDDSASGAVTSTVNYAGGLIGYDLGSVSTSGATGNVGGVYNVGGLIGRAGAGSVLTSDTASGTATATYDYAGGLVGANLGTISGSSATGQVSGRNFDGGLAGYNDGTITNITAGATPQIVGGAVWVGGLVGYNAGAIGASGSSVASNATVTATGDDAGGLVGENTGSITDASAAGSASGPDYVGGLVGYNFHGTVVSSTVTASYSSPGTHKGPVYGANRP